MKKICYLLLMQVLFVFTASAAVKTAITNNGGWNSSGTWSGNSVPQAGDDVIIPSGINVNTSATSNSCTSLDLQGSLTFTGGSGRNIVVSGNVTIGGTILMTGSNAYYLSFGGTLTISSGATLTMTSSATEAGFRYIGTGSGTITNNSSQTIGSINVTGTGSLTTGSSFTMSKAITVGTATGSFNVATGHTVTTTGGATTVSTSGGKINVTGILTNSSATAWVLTGTGALTVNNGGVYRHNINGGTIPTATWNTGSTCEITGNTATAPSAGLGQTFSNFTWNSSGQTTTTNLTGNLTTINGNFSVLNTGAATNGLRLTNATATLNVGGNLIVSSGNTAKLDLNGSAGTSTINVTGDVNIGSSGTLLCNSAAGAVKLKGNWSNSGTFTVANTSVEFNSTTANQSITKTGGETFNTLVINNSFGSVTLANNVSAATLTLTAGKVATGANSITVTGTSGLSTGGSTNYVNGTLIRAVAAGASTVAFPIGTASAYSPVSVAFAAGTLANNTTASAAIPGAPPASGNPTAGSGISQTNYINRNWTLAFSAAPVYSATFTYINSGDVAGSPTLSALRTSQNTGGSWTVVTGSSSAPTVTTASGLTTGGTFSAGDIAANPVISPATNTFSSAFTTTYGTASADQTVSVSGTGLSADITATAATNFEVSNGGAYGPTTTFTQSGGSASGTLHVRLKATAPVSGSYNSITAVSLTSTGATQRDYATAASGNAVSTVNLLITGITAVSRAYNGNNTATLSGTAAYSGLQNGESFSVSGTPSATFDDENVGTGKTVTVSGYTAPSSNYTVSQPSLSADISPRTLTVTATGIDKAYDGTTTATVTLGDNRVSGDDISTTYTFAAFVTAAAGTNKTVNVSGISLNGGSDQGNYTLGNSTTSTTANITGVSESSANFRSRANGSLSSASTWEFDGGGGGYVNATVKPGTGNNVEILHNVTFDEGFTVGAGKTLKVTSGTADFNGQLVTFKSTAAGTASFGPLLGSLTGENNVTVERYIPNGNRSWRLLSAPTHTSGQTVRQAWMEGDANPSANQNNAPGYGTIITAVAAQVANGFDATATNTSIRTYNGSTFVAMNSVNVALASTSGYFLYIRGDRSITPAGTSTSATTLRSHGTLYKGSQTGITVPANTFGLIGNIYASEIDFDNITKSNVVNTLYVWDAKMGATGGYETFPGIDDFKASTGGGSWALNEVNSKVQSGQAFFVAATNVNGSVTLSESAKSTGSSTKGLRPAAQSAVSKLKTRLLAGDKAYDGNVVVFNNKYQNTIDANDAPKFDNPGENFAIVSEGKQLAAEARQLAGTESIAYAMKNMKQQDYALEFTATNLGSGEAYLEDKFLGTKTPVSLTGVTKVSFSVTADPQSAAAGRFQLVLRPAAAPAVDNRIASISVYPNPVETGTMNVQFVKQAKGKYNLKLVDLAGRVVYSSVREHAGGSAAQSVQLPSAIGRGSYQLVITNPDKTKQVQQLFINK
ncbi:MAG: YDG domain-containing protein [Ferruginibacter sp.]